MKNVGFFILLALITFGCKTDSTQRTQPNVIIIFTDDQGYQDLACFGSPDILTPNIDQLAQEGIRLTDFYSAQAVCSASRAGLLTGCYPNRVGVHGAFFPYSKKGLDSAEVTIAEMLKEVGYQTAIYGKWHLGDHPDFMPNRQGFNQFFGIPYSNDMWAEHPANDYHNFDPLPLYENEQVIEFVEDQTLLTTRITEHSLAFIDENKDKPFFLYVAHPQPHVPLFVSDKFKGKSARGLYGDVIMEIDWSTGQIMDKLEEHNLTENTLVIYTSDNGPWLNYGNHSGSALPLREGKGTALEGGQRVPCVIRYPAKIPAGKTLAIPMMNIDIFPTIASYCQATLPEQKIDGKNVAEVWNGAASKGPQEAYFYYYHQNELHGVRYKNWKLYFPHRYRTLNGREGGKDGKPVNYEYNTMEEIELYDLSKDISETKNVAEENPSVVQTIQNLADSMRVELGDALVEVEGRGVRPVGQIEVE